MRKKHILYSEYCESTILSIDVSELTQGVYLLTIRQNGINKIVKIKKKD